MTGQANFTPENVSDDEPSAGFRQKTRNNFNYIQLALNNAQSAAQSAIDDVKSTIIKPALRGGFAVNDIRYFGTLANAVAMIPSGSAQTLYITTAQNITADLTVPSNIAIVMTEGGSFALTAGKVLRFNGAFESQGIALGPFFSGAGTFQFGAAVRLIGVGSPEGVITAPVGSEYLRTDGSASTTLYIKESGSGNTGWVSFSAYSEGSFSAVLTGTAGAVTQTARWIRVGNHVTLYIPHLVGTSNANTCTITGLPAGITPARDWSFLPWVMNNNSIGNGTGLVIKSNGVIQLYVGALTSFTASGSKGLYTLSGSDGYSFPYHLL